MSGVPNPRHPLLRLTCAAQAEQLTPGVPNPGGGGPENPKLAAEQLTLRVTNSGCGDPENPKHLLLTLSIGCLKTLGAGANTV